MPTLKDRDDGLVDVTFDDGSRLAMMPSVVKSAGLYEQPAMPKPPTSQAEQFAQAVPVPPPQSIFEQSGVERNVTDWAAPPKAGKVNLAPATPTRSRVPSTAERPGQSEFDPAFRAKQSTASGPMTETREVRPAPVRAGSASKGLVRSKAKTEGLDPNIVAEIAGPGQLEVEGARAGVNIQLEEQARQQQPQLKEVADFLDQIANERENRAAEAMSRRQAADAELMRRGKVLDARLEAIRNEPSARDKVMQDKGWFGQILAAIGLAMGAGTQAMTGQNPARDMLNDQVAAEMERRDRREKLYGREDERMQELRDHFKDSEVARQAAELEIMEAQNARLSAFAASAESENTRTAIQLVLAQRQEDYANQLQQLRFALAGKVANEYSRPAPVGGGTGKTKQEVKVQTSRGDVWMSLEDATKFYQIDEQARQRAGLPPLTAASIQEREASNRKRSLNDPFNPGRFLFLRDEAQRKEISGSIANFEDLLGTLNDLERYRDEFTKARTPTEKKAGYENLQRASQAAAHVWGNMRKTGEYGVPTGKDVELIDREMGNIGQNLIGPKGASALDPRFKTSVDEIRRISTRKLRAQLRNDTSTDPVTIIPPDFPLAGEAPPGETGAPSEGTPLLQRGVRSIPRPQ